MSGHKCGGCSDSFPRYAGLLRHYDECPDNDHANYLARHKHLRKDVKAFQDRQNEAGKVRTTKAGSHNDTVYAFVAASWAERARELAHSAWGPDDVAKELYNGQGFFTWPEFRTLVHGALAGTRAPEQSQHLEPSAAAAAPQPLILEELADPGLLPEDRPAEPTENPEPPTSHAPPAILEETDQPAVLIEHRDTTDQPQPTPPTRRQEKKMRAVVAALVRQMGGRQPAVRTVIRQLESVFPVQLDTPAGIKFVQGALEAAEGGPPGNGMDHRAIPPPAAPAPKTF